MLCFLLFCGSELARDGGLPADQFLSSVPSPTVGASLLAKAACQPTNHLLMHTDQIVGASLLAKAACQPPNHLQMYSAPVGASLLAKAT
ncbi:hypothetical protein D3C75_1198840 [compost metagenome]